VIGRAVKRKKWVKYIGSQVRIFMGFFDYLFKQNPFEISWHCYLILSNNRHRKIFRENL